MAHAPGPPGNSKQKAPIPTEVLSSVANAAAMIAAASAAHVPPPRTKRPVKENAVMLPFMTVWVSTVMLWLGGM